MPHRRPEGCDDDEMRVMLVTPSLADNSLGRTYCLDLLIASLGWEAMIWSTDGEAVWGPLRDDPFAARCFRARGTREEIVRTLAVEARRFDLIIAVKPLGHSLGLAWSVHQVSGIPLVADIDDPDIDVQLATGRPLRALAKRILLRRIYAAARDAAAIAGRVPRIVSNPELQRRHGGVVVPHVRALQAPVLAGDARAGVEVAFVGSVQPHKGISVLRAAVDLLAAQGYRLVITADPPADARAHETWVGRTTLQQGLDLVAGADVVVIPSLSDEWSRGQLPVKVVDAMLLGTCVIVSDIAPLPWAVGHAGLVVPAGDVTALVEALRVLSSPQEREWRSSTLSALARSRYTVEANQRVFEAVCSEAVLPGS